MVLLAGTAILCAAEGAAQEAPVFNVFGEVLLSDGESLSTFADTVRVANQATGSALHTTVGALEQGRYGITLVDYAENRAAAVGDSLAISLIADTGGLLATMWCRVTAEDVAAFGLHQPLIRFDGSSSVIFGWVRDESGHPVEGATVEVTDVLQQEVVASALSIDTGFFAAGGLVVGGYRVEVIPSPGSYLLGEYYDDVPSYDPANVAQARTLWFVPHAVFEADFTLAQGGSFRGS